MTHGTELWLADRSARWLDGNRCSFGITEVIAGVLAPVIGETAAGFAAPALLGSATGALGSEIMGGNPLLGALTGGVTGGLVPVVGPAIGGALDIGTTAGEALTGAALGAAGSAVTGGNPLIGAATGGLGPIAQNVIGSEIGTIGGSSSGGTTAGAQTAPSPVSGAGTSAAGSAAPAGAALDPATAGLLASPDVAGGTSISQTGATPTTTGLSFPADVGAPGAAPTNITPTSSNVDPLASTLAATGVTDISLSPGLSGALAGSPQVNISGGASDATPIAYGGAGGGATADAALTGGGTGAGGGTTYSGETGFNPAESGLGLVDLSSAGNFGGGSDAGTGRADPFGASQPGSRISAGLDINNPAAGAENFGGGGTGAGSKGMLSNLLGGDSSLSKMLTNPMTLLAGGALAYDFLKQPKLPSVGSSIAPIQSTANQFTTQGSQLASYLQSGTLPPGVQQGIDQAVKSAQATIRSRYAAMGADPNTSSAALQDQQAVADRATAEGANIALSLLNTGINESQLGAALYTELLNTTLQQDQQLGNAIGNFASAMIPRTVITQPSTVSA